MADLQRTWPSLSLAAALLAAPSSGEPPLRRVVTDLRISSERIQDALPPAVITELRKRIAVLIADEARTKFGYLEWVPQPAAGAGGMPLLVLEVFQESAGTVCNAKVRWRFVGETSPVRVSGVAQDLDNGCNPRPRFRNERDFEDDLKDAVRKFLAEQWAGIQSGFLRRVPLVSRLETDAVKKKVLLPLAAGQLLAHTDSKLRVDFTVDQERGEMTLRPWQAAGGRTQVLLRSLVCGSIVPPCRNLSDGTAWDDSLPGLLERCSGLRVFMDEYVPELAGQTRDGVITDLRGDEP